MKRRVFISLAIFITGLAMQKTTFAENCTKPVLSVSEIHKFTIVVSPNAIPSEKYAAEEFQRFFELATGVNLQIKTIAEKSSENIFIGTSKQDISNKKLGEEGLVIEISSNNIWIKGGKPRGTLYGVYEFFEKYLGLRFLTVDHTYCPPDITNYSIPCEEFTYIPPFDLRWSCMYETNFQRAFGVRLRNNAITDDPIYNTSNELDEQFGGNCPYRLITHSFYFQVPPQKYIKDNPEFFAMRDGKRPVSFEDKWGARPNICSASKKVEEIVSNAVIDFFDQNPHLKNTSVSDNDSKAYCQCNRCNKINNAQGSPMGAHLDFVNRVANNVSKKYPDKKIGTLAYRHTRKPPADIIPANNVQIQLCDYECCRFHALDDPSCKQNAEFCNDLKAWGKKCKDIRIWTYNTNFRHFLLPFPNLKSISKNIRFFRDNNVKGIFFQGPISIRGSEFCDLRNYVTSRCLWNPELDSWNESLEFCRLHYGQAAQPIINWLTYLHDHIEKKTAHFDCSSSYEELCLTPQIALKAYEYFQQALKLADNDSIHNRVEKASIFVYQTLIETAEFKREGDYLKLVFPEKFSDTISKYKQLIKTFQVTSPNENFSFGKYYKMIAPKRCYQIENEYWKLVILPDFNGKIVKIEYKPNNQDILKSQLMVSHENRIVDDLFYVGPIQYRELNYKIVSISPQSITLTATLPNNIRIKKEIQLSQNITFNTTITNASNTPTLPIRIRVSPEFYTNAINLQQNEIQVSYKSNNNQWTEMPVYHKNQKEKRGWVSNKNVESIRFFNMKKNYGVRLSFTPELVNSLGLWQNINKQYTAIGLYTVEQTLKPSESIRLKYDLNFIESLNN